MVELRRNIAYMLMLKSSLRSIRNSNYENGWIYPGVNVTAYEDDKLRYIDYTNLPFLDIRNPSNVSLLSNNMSIFYLTYYMYSPGQVIPPKLTNLYSLRVSNINIWF